MKRVIIECRFQGTKTEADQITGYIEEWFSIRNLDIGGEQLLLTAMSGPELKASTGDKQDWAIVLDGDVSTQLGQGSADLSNAKVKEGLEQGFSGIAKGTAFDGEARALFANISVGSIFMTPLLHPVSRHDV